MTVTDDIVTRLIAEIADTSSETSKTLLAEAADAIIRWRAEVQRLVWLKESAKKKSPDLDVLGLLRKYENLDAPKKQAAAKKRAAKAGRPYPNLVDNAAVSRRGR